jgi:hypothetical protein
MKGFLGTWASLCADLNLLIQFAMGLALLVGAFLARAKRYTAHGACLSFLKNTKQLGLQLERKITDLVQED